MQTPSKFILLLFASLIFISAFSHWYCSLKFSECIAGAAWMFCDEGLPGSHSQIINVHIITSALKVR